MRSTIEWGVWIAGLGLIVGIAKFIDEYHIRNDLRSIVKDKLVAVFLFLDRPQIVNFPDALYNYLVTTLRKFGRVASITAAFVAYFAIVATFYLGRRLFNDAPASGFLVYAATWIDSIFWAVIMLWGLGTGAASFITVGAFLDRWNGTVSLLRHWIITVLVLITLAMIALGTAAGFFLLGSLNPTLGLPGIVAGSGVLLVGSPLFLLILSSVCLWHAIALGFAMLLITVFQSLYLLVHRGVLSVLSAASSPTTSPFQYFAALIALCAIAFKLASELSK